MSGFPIGSQVRVKSGVYHRYINNPDLPEVRLFNGQTFHLSEDDAQDLERGDIDLLLEMIDEAPDQPAIDPDAEPDVWGEDIDTEALSEQLGSMNVATAKKWLSRDEWTEAGMAAALEAEQSGQARKSVIEFIEGRQLDLAEGDVEEGSGPDATDESDDEQD